MTHLFAIVVITVISTLCSFLCSLMEAALYSIAPGKIEEMRRAGLKSGERLARLRRQVDEPISAILTMNTVANTVGAVIGGALVGSRYNDALVGVYSGVFTLIILFISEIIPKTLGVTFTNRLAPALSLPILLLVRALYPFVVGCRLITGWIRRKGAKTPGAAGPSEAEILALAEMGAQSGVLSRDEARWAANALRLNDVEARELMTPRTVVVYYSAERTLAEVGENPGEWIHSRIPIVRNNNPDEVIGVAHRREVFDRYLKASPEERARITLRDVMRPAIFVPETLRCDELLRMFLRERQQLIIVANEFGGMEGVISLEDVLEFILGQEIVDLFDPHPDMQDLARREARRRLALARRSLAPPAGAEPDSPAPEERR